MVVLVSEGVCMQFCENCASAHNLIHGEDTGRPATLTLLAERLRRRRRFKMCDWKRRKWKENDWRRACCRTNWLRAAQTDARETRLNTKESNLTGMLWDSLFNPTRRAFWKHSRRGAKLRLSPIAFGNQTISSNAWNVRRDSRLCVPASRQVCHLSCAIVAKDHLSLSG